MKKTIAISLCLLALSPLTASAQEIDADAAIKYRKAVMTAIKGHNAAIKSIVTGKVPYGTRLGGHVDAMQGLFAELEELFPEGSDFGETNAKAAIWDKPEKFAATIDKARQALDGLSRAVKSGAGKGELVKAYKQFGKNSCASCHKQFKAKPKS